jgi:hypothetical protein
LRSLDKWRNLATESADDLIAQPARQTVRIGDRGFAEAEAAPDLGAETLGRAITGDGLVINRKRQVELLAQCLDRVRIHLRGVTWNTAECPAARRPAP